MHPCLLVGLVLLTLCGPATASGFEFGNGVPMTNGLIQVTYNLDKGFRSRVAGCRIGMLEVRLTYANNVVKRTSMFYIGSHMLRTPLSVEALGISTGAILIFIFLGAAGLLTWRGLSKKPVEPAADPSATR